jgi:hypothetical protein
MPRNGSSAPRYFAPPGLAVLGSQVNLMTLLPDTGSPGRGFCDITTPDPCTTG